MFTISIFNARGGIHHTTPVPAVYKTKAVPQFMKYRLFYPVREEIVVYGLVIKLRIKSVQGNNSALTFHQRQSKDIFEYWHIKVHLGDAYEPECVTGATLKEMIQNQF